MNSKNFEILAEDIIMSLRLADGLTEEQLCHLSDVLHAETPLWRQAEALPKHMR